MQSADGAIVVCDMTPPSLIDALRTMKHASKHNCPTLGLVMNRAATKRHAEETSALLGAPILVSIPEHKRFNVALHKHRPVALLYPHSSLTKLFNELADYVIS